MMRVLVVGGCGAIGSFISYLLNAIGHDVTILDREAKNCEEKNLKVLGIGEARVKVCGYSQLINKKFDQIVYAVKSYDLHESIRLINKYNIRADVAFSLQNGLGSLKMLESKYRNVVGVVMFYGLEKIEKCVSKFNGGSKIVIGCKGDCEELLSSWDSLSSTGVVVKKTNRIEDYIWLKACINSAINPISAILWRNNGYILENSEAFKLAVEICKETSEVAKRLGIKLPEDPVNALIKTLKDTYNNCSSTIQDISKKKRTELDAINLAIYEAGKKVGYLAKYNYFAYRIVSLIKKNLEGKPYPCNYRQTLT
ncbi:MAG: 2-dehydropantoate 2-reductase [Caldisphaeraceae archaeon]|nr:2-dehydropantoate 2-reductase [Caldisphaeraceae archaeon]